MTKKLVLILSISVLTMTQLFAIDKFVVNGLFQNQTIVTIDGKQRLLKQGETTPEGVTLIESDSKAAIIDINGEQNTYTLGDHISSAFSQSVAENTLILSADASGMFTTSGSINGAKVNFVVDTGASVVFINNPTAKRLGIDYKLNGIKSKAYTASGIDNIYVVKFEKVRIGNIEFRNIEGAISDNAFPTIALLGMSFLERLSMAREGRLLKLEQKN